MSNEELSARVADLTLQIQTLREENAHLREENAQFREQLDQQQRAMDELQSPAFRQAAPFRVPEERRKGQKKKPGRRKGHKAHYRPVPDHVDEHISVALDCCPVCGGPVDGVQAVEQYIEDIPAAKVHVTKLVTHVGRCRRCGEVRSSHPLQMSLARGCAKVQLGPWVLGIAAQLKEHLGLSFRKQREHLFTFLEQPGVPPDNNLAQRQLRPAVIARKLSCGNRTASGKDPWEVLCSIAATCQQRLASFIELIARATTLNATPPLLTDISG